jgi:uncharacterized protein (TIGR03435 family)
LSDFLTLQRYSGMRQLFALTAFALSAAFGQSFEVASITPCAPGSPLNPMEHTGTVQLVFPGRFQAKADTPKFLMEWAYGIQPSQHSKGPEWFETGCFDIVAKPESASATEADIKWMLQVLLAERFQLRFHVEQRELPVYAFGLGKTAPKLAPSPDAAVQSLQMSRGAGSDARFPTVRVAGTRFTVAKLADTFSRQLGRPVVDLTGLRGEFDFTVDLTPDETRPNVLDESILLTAMREQLGLSIKADRAVVDYYVIDSVARTAVGN